MSAPSVRVELEPFAQAHREATWRWLQDASLRAALDVLEVPTRDGNEALWAARAADRGREDYAVLAGGEHVGNGGLLLDPARRKAELWLYVAEARGGGIGSAAGELLLDRAFAGLGLHRAAVRVLSTNPAAERFWRRLGFVPEGCLRDDTWAGGTPADSLWLGLLAHERVRPAD